MHDHLNFLFELSTAVEPYRYPCIYSSSMLESLIFCRRTTHLYKQQARYVAIIVRTKYPLVRLWGAAHTWSLVHSNQPLWSPTCNQQPVDYTCLNVSCQFVV